MSSLIATNGPCFLSIPAELRVQVYKYALYDAAGTSTLPTLEHHRGFVLSCKQIYSEFESEWCKSTNALLAVVTQNTILLPTPFSKFRDTLNLLVLMKHDLIKSDDSQVNSKNIMPQLVRCARSLTIIPDTVFPPLDGTLRGLFKSPQYASLRMLEKELLQTFSITDYWVPALYCTKSTKPPIEIPDLTHLTRLENQDKACRLGLVIWLLVGKDGTMEELREFRGALRSSRIVAMYFGFLCRSRFRSY